jgi:hypothetical protein
LLATHRSIAFARRDRAKEEASVACVNAHLVKRHRHHKRISLKHFVGPMRPQHSHHRREVSHGPSDGTSCGHNVLLPSRVTRATRRHSFPTHPLRRWLESKHTAVRARDADRSSDVGANGNGCGTDRDESSVTSRRPTWRAGKVPRVVCCAPNGVAAHREQELLWHVAFDHWDGTGVAQHLNNQRVCAGGAEHKDLRRMALVCVCVCVCVCACVCACACDCVRYGCQRDTATAFCVEKCDSTVKWRRTHLQLHRLSHPSPSRGHSP